MPKDDLLYLQKELEEHLNKSEHTPFTSEENQLILDDLNGEGIVKETEGFSQSTFTEQIDSPTPSMEEDFLPPAPPVKSENQEVLQEESELGDHFYPEAPHQEELNNPEFAPHHFQEDVAEIGEESKEHFDDQKHFEAQQYYDESEQFANQEYFDNREHFEDQKLHEEPEQYDNREHFEIQDQLEDQDQHEGLAQFENQQSLDNQEHFESKELQDSQEQFENQHYLENQDHYESQEYCEEEREPDAQFEIPPEHPPTPELLHASEQVEHIDNLLENSESYIEAPQDTSLLDAAHMDLVGGIDQFAVEKQESTAFHSTAGIGGGEAVINDFEQAASLTSSECSAEPNRHMADALGVVVSERPVEPQPPPIIQTKDPVQQKTKPSFHDIKKNLEKRK